MAKKRSTGNPRKDEPVRPEPILAPGDSSPRPPRAETNGGDAPPRRLSPQPRVTKSAGRSKPPPEPRPSDLSNALYLWLSRRPAWVQNIVLVVFGLNAVLFFFAPVVALAWGGYQWLPKKIPPIQMVIRNLTERDVDLLRTGQFTIEASEPQTGSFDLEPVEEAGLSAGGAVRVPPKGGEIRVKATIRNSPKYHEYYAGGEYPLTLQLQTSTQPISAYINPFSKANLRREWPTPILEEVSSERVIAVCFEMLDDVRKQAILKEKKGPATEDLVLWQEETESFIEDFGEEIERGQYFEVITPERFDEILKAKLPPHPTDVFAKIAIGIYECGNQEPILLWEVADANAHSPMRKSDQVPYKPGIRPYHLRNLIQDTTRAMTAKYPIVGRISDLSRDNKIAEMKISRLAGIREGTMLHVYLGRISEDTFVGWVRITDTWPSSCEGELQLTHNLPSYLSDSPTSLLVSSPQERLP
jgi:hypothetical protein